VLGVKFMLDASTMLENGTPTNGDFVEVEDRDRDGFAESVEVEDATNHDGEFARPDDHD
jgi:hypothetical protein